MQDVQTDRTMVIVGVAASAGGLEATSLLAQNLPDKLNCAYVLAQHMSPSHKSMLVQLLARETTLDVEQITAPTVPQQGTIYVPPPGSDVLYMDGRLVLAAPEGHAASPKPSADRLLKSLAQGVGEYAVGIVLSGTGSDGSYGVQAIREAGGITIAQDPDSCKYDSMPVSAVRTGCIDLTLTPQQIGRHLAKILERPRDLSSQRAMFERDRKNSDLFQILLSHTRVDFRHYKETTINRRIHRRMIAKGIENFRDYVEHCRGSVEEVEALYRDLLISVTSFFRDPEHFRTLAKVIGDRMKDNPDEPIRIWIPGCATGEEAYSIAILVVEALGGIDQVAKDRLHIFATDIDDRALAIGRKGVYPSSAMSDIPAEYVDRYFLRSDDRIEVIPRLRAFLMFTRHNVFQDSPFMSIDLVSIRNVLIYFEARLQERVLTRVLYALKPEGLLFLGTSETTGVVDSTFASLSPNTKIYRKRSNRLPSLADLDTRLPVDLQPRRRDDRRKSDVPTEDRQRFDALVRSVVTTGILTNPDKIVLRIFGDIAPFVEMKAPVHGNMTLNVLSRTLAFEAGSMVLVALKQKEPRTGQWHHLEGRDFNNVRMTAYPIITDGDAEPLVLIGFETETRTPPAPPEKDQSDYAEYLEAELNRTRETLQVAIEQLQTSNEELQSLNEELQSSNEELQSTNEELETSNEELQSTNEELITVNEELLVNNSELERATAELNGLIAKLPTELMMLDPGLLIRHASESAVATFELRHRGHAMGHLSQCRIPTGYPPLVDLCAQVMTDRRPVSIQFETFGRAKALSVTPLVTDGNDLIGLVVLIDSVDLMLDTLLDKALSNLGRIGTWRADLVNGTVTWSEEVYRIHGLDPDDGLRDYEENLRLIDPEDRARVRGVLEDAIATGEPYHMFARMSRADGRTVVIETAGAVLQDASGRAVALIGVVRDHSRMRINDLRLRQSADLAARLGLGFFCHDIGNRLLHLDARADALLGRPATPAGDLDDLVDAFAPDQRDVLRDCLDHAARTGDSFSFTGDILQPDGTRRRCRATGQAESDKDGATTHLFGWLEAADEHMPAEGGS